MYVSMGHTIIKDLVGKTVDPWLQTDGTHALLLLYWEKCTHCEALMPAYEKVAARLQKGIAANILLEKFRSGFSFL